ncbi:MAG: hypothetical protein ABSB35_03785 [Bryobacteraceae bacterium]|jgi:uncharacterized protein (TIGR03437 family)
MKKRLFRRVAIAVLTAGLPAAALADVTGSVTLQANNAFSLDTGTTSSSGGDILWTGTQISFQGNAKGANVGDIGAADFNLITLAIAQGFEPQASTTPIPNSALVVGDVFGVLTNGSNIAKVLVTANSGGSITLQYDTFGASSTGPSGPTVTNVENGSSTIPPGFPNSGVAPSSLIVIHGTGMSDAGTAVLQDTMKGLPLTLNGASVSVTVNGVTVHPALYYTDTNPSQLAAVLPAATPVGTGTITVTYNNVPSTPAPIQVVSSAPGITTYENGTGVATDAVTGALLGFTSSGTPGETIILWGTGLGADPADSDTTYTSTPHQTSVPLQVYIGGVQANVVYQGASVYPGVDVIGLVIPASVPTGCYVSLEAVVGTVVSNVVSLPIAAGGGACSDPEFGITGSQISSLSGQSTVPYGSVYVAQTTSPGTTPGTTQVSDVASAYFEQVAGTSYAGSGPVSLGGCSLTQTVVGSTPPTVTGLDAGTITVTGPSGGPVTLTAEPGLTGLYFTQLPAGAIPSSGGSFTFNGAGGAVVGPFMATVNFPNPLLSWTNQSAAATVTRSQGLTVTWQGGAAGSYVQIGGSSSSSSVSASYTCTAPVAAGQFTVPSYILLAMPAGSGTTMVQNSTSIGSFSVKGIEAGTSFGSVSFSANSTYQ